MVKQIFNFVSFSKMASKETCTDALSDFLAQLRVLLSSLDEEGVPEGVPTHEKWQYVISKIQNQLPKCKLHNYISLYQYFLFIVIKLVVTYLRDGSPSFEDGVMFVGILKEQLYNLVSLYQIISSGASDTLHIQLKKKMKELMEGFLNLITELINENQQFSALVEAAGSEAKKNEQSLPVDRMFGCLEGILIDLQKCPIDNYHAATTEIQSYNQLIRDAMKELQEAYDEESIEETDKGDVDEEDEYWDVGDEFNLSPEQKKVVPPCIILIKTAGGVLVQINKAIKEASPSKEGNVFSFPYFLIHFNVKIF